MISLIIIIIIAVCFIYLSYIYIKGFKEEERVELIHYNGYLENKYFLIYLQNNKRTKQNKKKLTRMKK